LSFISVDSYACQKELELLKVLYDKHKDDFRVISISIDDDFEKAKAYFEQHGFEWPLLDDTDDKSTAKAYKVRAYPSYYLIDPDGKLIMSPAAGPAENFEWHFFNLLQSKRRGQNR
jgi:peroxiredoxin